MYEFTITTKGHPIQQIDAALRSKFGERFLGLATGAEPNRLRVILNVEKADDAKALIEETTKHIERIEPEPQPIREEPDQRLDRLEREIAVLKEQIATVIK